MLVVRAVRVFLVLLCLSSLALNSHAQAPVGEVVATDASVRGAVAASVGGMRVMSGSSVTAGASNASVRLLRGGELRVCRGSSISLTGATKGTGLLVGLSGGSLEAHYPLGESADTIWTPDFRITLAGPARFHLAVSTDDRGNTCVQSLHGNMGNVTVSELLGGESYRLKDGEEVMFRGGRVSNPGPVAENCGCPAAPPLHRASVEPPRSVAEAAPLLPVASLLTSTVPANVSAPLPAERPGDIHIQVEAPFVFRASEPPPVPDAPRELARIRLSDLPILEQPPVEPPAEKIEAATPVAAPPTVVAEDKPKKKKRGFWGAIASIFRG